jgi:hypothetical protein
LRDEVFIPGAGLLSTIIRGLRMAHFDRGRRREASLFAARSVWSYPRGVLMISYWSDGVAAWEISVEKCCSDTPSRGLSTSATSSIPSYLEPNCRSTVAPSWSTGIDVDLPVDEVDVKWGIGPSAEHRRAGQ